jgi:hypothetical protein
VTIPDEIEKLAKLYREKHAEYGDTEVFVGEVLAGLFPSGVALATRLDFARFALFHHVVNKVLRYAKNFASGGHDDSLRDLALYSMMLREIDARPPDRLRDDVPHAEPHGEQRPLASDRRVPRFDDRLRERRDERGD